MKGLNKWYRDKYVPKDSRCQAFSIAFSQILVHTPRMAKNEEKPRIGRPTKDWRAVTFKFDRELFELLEEFAADNERTKTSVVEEAVRRYLKRRM